MSDLLFLTGFEPFGGSDRNFSRELVERLAREPALAGAGAEIAAAILPTVYARATASALERLAALPRRPAMMVSFGEADRDRLSLETGAWNLDDAAKPDNAGETRRGLAIEPGAPARREFGFPVDRMLTAAGDVPAELSLSPGYYVCNHLAFTLAGELGARGIPFTFIHVPSTKRAPDLEAHARAVGRMLAAARAALDPCLLPHA